MVNNIYYGVGPTFQTHIAKHGFPRKGDLLFDTYDYGKKIKIENNDFTVLNPAENIELLIKGQIIICSSAHKQIIEYLKKLKPNSFLKIKISDTITVNNDEISYRLITSCIGDGESGGAFRVIWDRDNKKLDRLCSGQIRGIAFKGNDLFGVDENLGLGFIGQNGFELLKSIENKNLHSMVYDKDIDQFILAETYSDSIVFLSGKDFGEKKRLKLGKVGRDQHHINSLCIHDGYLYFSAFSFKGIWRLGIWNDGCIGRIPLDTNSMNDVELISTGLRQPHSVLVDSSQTSICESQERTLLVGTRVKAKLYGYTRGLCRVSSGYFLGCSQIRRQNNFIRDEVPYARGASINLISNNFSNIESINVPNLSDIYEIIMDV